jgi:hypothetical protein
MGAISNHACATSRWLYDTFTGTAPEQSAAVHCLEGLMSLECELWMKHGGHKDLCGSGRQRLTPYVHGRCVYCSVLSKKSVELA